MTVDSGGGLGKLTFGKGTKLSVESSKCYRLQRRHQCVTEVHFRGDGVFSRLTSPTNSPEHPWRFSVQTGTSLCWIEANSELPNFRSPRSQDGTYSGVKAHLIVGHSGSFSDGIVEEVPQ